MTPYRPFWIFAGKQQSELRHETNNGV
ncbi:hypothetical protein PIIN_11464 [Serendipita indica DSM 11827]|uniref:Uncharacterized protein n=1 Tax=Serendipita indica (strain DSM 11827) TaxID=1109443 RepID=G4U1P4_SERID|nr:hypothetical protein PIIN_11464 [Serendipita indica DSM 11827]